MLAKIADARPGPWRSRRLRRGTSACRGGNGPRMTDDSHSVSPSMAFALRPVMSWLRCAEPGAGEPPRLASATARPSDPGTRKDPVDAGHPRRPRGRRCLRRPDRLAPRGTKLRRSSAVGGNIEHATGIAPEVTADVAHPIRIDIDSEDPRCRYLAGRLGRPGYREEHSPRAHWSLQAHG